MLHKLARVELLKPIYHPDYFDQEEKSIVLQGNTAFKHFFVRNHGDNVIWECANGDINFQELLQVSFNLLRGRVVVLDKNPENHLEYENVVEEFIEKQEI